MNIVSWAVIIISYIWGVYYIVVYRGQITPLYIVLLVSIIYLTLIAIYLIHLKRKRRSKNGKSLQVSEVKDSNNSVIKKKVIVAAQPEPEKAAPEIAHYGDSGLMVQISHDRSVKWVKDGVVVRIPRQDASRPLGPGYVIGGKQYQYISDLTVKTVDEERRLYQDIHGRYVLDLKERYPIFDSYDAATENRYYHWYLVLDVDRMSMVYYDDGSAGKDEIVEDIQKLPDSPFRILNIWHYLDKDGILKLETAG